MDKEIRNFIISLNIKDPDILEKTPQRFINFLTENSFGYKFDLSTILKDKRGIFQNGGKNNSPIFISILHLEAILTEFSIALG